MLNLSEPRCDVLFSRSLFKDNDAVWIAQIPMRVSTLVFVQDQMMESHCKVQEVDTLILLSTIHSTFCSLVRAVFEKRVATMRGGWMDAQ